MTAAALAAAPRPVVRINFRDPVAEDIPYVLDSWRQSWRLSERCRRMRGAEYRAYFDSLVPDGIMRDPSTRVLLGTSEADPTWIWSWLAFTPGSVPTLHFGCVRRDISIEGRDEPLPLRRLGIFARMIAAAGVRNDCVYTFRPSERSHRQSKRSLGVEDGLLAAARLAGISAVYRSAEEFLGRRRSNR